MSATAGRASRSLEVSVAYELDDAGLSVATTATNTTSSCRLPSASHAVCLGQVGMARLGI